jgi:putative endonuclease
MSTARTTNRKSLGEFGERLAIQHLEATGYRIVARNHRTRYGEIDVIATRGDSLVFAEVKCRRGGLMGSASDSITPTKAARIVALAEAYAAERPRLPPNHRIDVIAVDLLPEGRVLPLRHFENAVFPVEN